MTLPMLRAMLEHMVSCFSTSKGRSDAPPSLILPQPGRELLVWTASLLSAVKSAIWGTMTRTVCTLSRHKKNCDVLIPRFVMLAGPGNFSQLSKS